MKNCLIISGGTFSVPAEHFIKSAAFIIACDKGLEYSLKMNLKPDIALGDFDSYNGNLPGGINILRLPCEKDDTDTMYAVKYAVEKGFDSIVIACAFGGRFDHTFANIQAAAYAAEKGADVTVTGDGEEAFVFKNSSVRLEKRCGWSISVFSLSETSEGVFERGTKYTLEDAVMTNRYPIGVSNEWNAQYAEIGVKDGILLVVESKMI